MARSVVRGCLAVAGGLAVVVTLAGIAPHLHAQAPGGAAGVAIKTPWGEPDLQGIWGKGDDTPLQRPAKYADREFFTDEEVAAFDRQIEGILARENTEARRRRGTEKDVTGAYNAAVFTTHLRTGRRTSLIVDPKDGKIPPTTAAFQKARAVLREYQLALLQSTEICRNKERGCAGGKYDPTPSLRRSDTPPVYLSGGAAGVINRTDGPEDRSLGERCMGGALPDFNGFRRIVQTPGGVTMFYETGQGQGWSRSIPIGSVPHLPSSVRQWFGDSRGHWEGNTLVVDVTNFSPKSNFQGASETLHVVERWTRLDAETLEYAVTVEDPSTWTRPWTVKQELKLQSNKANRIYVEPRCHEGNYGLIGQLLASRAEETAFAEGRGPNPASRCIVDADCGGFAGGFADEGEDVNPLR